MTTSKEVESFRSVFWDDIAEDMKDPRFAKEYAKASARLASRPALIHNGGKP